MDPLRELSLIAAVLLVITCATSISQAGNNILQDGDMTNYALLIQAINAFKDVLGRVEAWRIGSNDVSSSFQPSAFQNYVDIVQDTLELGHALKFWVDTKNFPRTRRYSEKVDDEFRAPWSSREIRDIERRLQSLCDAVLFRWLIHFKSTHDLDHLLDDPKISSQSPDVRVILNVLGGVPVDLPRTVTTFRPNRSPRRSERNDRSPRRPSRSPNPPPSPTPPMRVDYTVSQDILVLLRNIIKLQEQNDEVSADFGIDVSRRGEIDGTILSSLAFETMKERETAVTKAYVQTFDWIWDREYESSDPDAQWDNFVEFLESDQRIYWISGKAGSGKSTLMKYINHHSLLETHLQPWLHEQRLYHVSFYFWYKGTELQKSKEGVLRSILHQILSKSKRLIPIVFKQRYEEMRCGLVQSFEPSYEELQEATTTLLQSHDGAFFISIDGLDEYDDGQQDFGAIARFFMRWSRFPNVKLLLSSRPLAEFESAFDGLNRLRLHSLTTPGLIIFVSAKLKENSRFQRLQSREPIASQRLPEAVVKSSGGVFLWVSIVIKLFLQDLRESNTVAILEQWLEGLPSDIQELYDTILSRVPSQHHDETNKILQIVRAGTMKSEHLTTLGLSFAMEGESAAILRPRARLTRTEAIARVEKMEEVLQTRCLGLVENSKLELGMQGLPPRLSDMQRHEDQVDRWACCQTVSFLHRSFDDFLDERDAQSGSTASTFLNQRGQREAAHIALLASIVQIIKAADPVSRSVGLLVGCAQRRFVKVETQTQTTYFKLFEIFGTLMLMLHGAHSKGTYYRILDGNIASMGSMLEKFGQGQCCSSGNRHTIAPTYDAGARALLVFAIHHGLARYVREKLEQNIDTIKRNVCHQFRWPPLMYALALDSSNYRDINLDIVRMLLEDFKCDPNQKIAVDGTEYTIWQLQLLRIAKASRAQGKILQTSLELVRNGADPNKSIKYNIHSRTEEQTMSPLRIFDPKLCQEKWALPDDSPHTIAIRNINKELDERGGVYKSLLDTDNKPSSNRSSWFSRASLRNKLKPR